MTESNIETKSCVGKTVTLGWTQWWAEGPRDPDINSRGIQSKSKLKLSSFF